MPTPSQGGGGIIIPPYLLVFTDWPRERSRMRRQLRDVWRRASREDVDDAIEAAVELLFVKALEFPNAEIAKGWLYAAAINCLRNERRKSKRHKIADLEEATEVPDGATMKSEKQELLELAMEALSEQDREILLARYMKGISITEYARRYGLKYEQLKKRQQRSLKKLKLIFKKLR